MNGTKRLFCAVKVPLTDGIEEVFDVYRNELSGEAIKWVEPHNLHLTLKFFGDTPADRLDAIVAALQSAARRFSSPITQGDITDGTLTAGIHPVLNFEVRGCGHFASRGQPRVIWMGIEKAEGLKRLYRLINEALLPMGYEPDRQAFSPHLTLGRIKSLRDKQSLKALEEEFADTLFASVSTTHFLLMESILRPQGPFYHEVTKFVIE